MKFIATILILVGLACFALAGYYTWLRNDPNRLSFKSYHYEQNVPINVKHFPVRITLNNEHIDLPIVPAHVSNNKWQTTQSGASYLLSSPIPGTQGNSVIYAHNWASLFGNLVNVKPGEKVVVAFSDGSKQTFTVNYTQTVSPDQSTILAPSDDKRITLYTCTGWFDSKRFVAVAIAN
jgi:LPXTG-site transpeptidase (sortase) family protein